jgi:hypothetical protein
MVYNRRGGPKLPIFLKYMLFDFGARTNFVGLMGITSGGAFISFLDRVERSRVIARARTSFWDHLDPLSSIETYRCKARI